MKSANRSLLLEKTLTVNGSNNAMRGRFWLVEHRSLFEFIHNRGRHTCTSQLFVIVSINNKLA